MEAEGGTFGRPPICFSNSNRMGTVGMNTLVFQDICQAQSV